MNRKNALKALEAVPIDEYALYLEKIQAEAMPAIPYLHHARQENAILRDPTCRIICTIRIPLQVQALIIEAERLRTEMSDLGDAHTSVYYELMEKLDFVRSLVYDWLLEEVIRCERKERMTAGWHPSYAVGKNWKMLVFATNNIDAKRLLQP